MNKLLYIIPFVIIGCTEQITPTANQVDPQIQAIVVSMADVSKEDAEKLYMVFGGLGLYIQQTEKVDTTLKVVSLVKSLEADFKYIASHKEYTDAVEKFLTDKNYKKVKKIVSVVNDDTKEFSRTQVVADVIVIAQAAKIVKDRVK